MVRTPGTLPASLASLYFSCSQSSFCLVLLLFFVFSSQAMPPVSMASMLFLYWQLPKYFLSGLSSEYLFVYLRFLLAGITLNSNVIFPQMSSWSVALDCLSSSILSNSKWLAPPTQRHASQLCFSFFLNLHELWLLPPPKFSGIHLLFSFLTVTILIQVSIICQLFPPSSFLLNSLYLIMSY